MVKVRFKEALFAEQTNTHYLKGAEVEVPEDLAKRHDENGTGILEILSAPSEKPAPAPEPVASKRPDKKQ